MSYTEWPEYPAKRELCDKIFSLRSVLRNMGDKSGVKLSDRLNIMKDDVSAIWFLREQEMDERQDKRDVYVKKYRPVKSISDWRERRNGRDFWHWQFLTMVKESVDING